MGDFDNEEEEEYGEEEIVDEDGCNEGIEVLNEEDEDSSQRQSSVVTTLAVDDKDEWIDSELELEDEIREDSMDCCEEDIVRLDDCSELSETSEDVDEVEVETLLDCGELLDSDCTELETSEDDDDVEKTGLDEEEEVTLEIRELDSEVEGEEYTEMNDEDGSNEEGEVNEEEDDSSQRQSSVVTTLAVDEKDEGIDWDMTELELDEDNFDCWGEDIEKLDDCSELLNSDSIELETSEDDDIKVETIDDCSELLDSVNTKLETSEDDDDVEQTGFDEEIRLEVGELGREKEEEYVEEEMVEDK
jgi:hypothetical protein